MTDVLSWHAERYPRAVLLDVHVVCSSSCLGLLVELLGNFDNYIVLESTSNLTLLALIVEGVELV